MYYGEAKNLVSVFFCLQYFLGVSVCMHVSVHMYVQEHLHMYLYACGGQKSRVAP